MEEWKSVNGFEGYLISNKGRVYSLKSHKYLDIKYAHGSHVVRFFHNGKIYCRCIKKLLNEHFDFEFKDVKFNSASPKHLIATNSNTGEELEFNSIREAGRYGFDTSNIRACLRGTQRVTKGFAFKEVV
jgi:hypothetical protein